MMMISPYVFTGGGSSEYDDHWSNVEYLLHLDGSMSNVKSGSVGSSGQIFYSESAFKFGGYSLAASASGRAYIESMDFNKEFTLEFWLRVDSLPSETKHFMSVQKSPYLWFYIQKSGSDLKLGFYSDRGNTVFAKSLTLGEFQHIALCRDSNSLLSIYISGSLQRSYTDAFSFTGVALDILGNSSSIGPQPENAFIDEIRFTQGVCRYASNFTPPVAAFPNQ